ncbi:sulfotransferase family 2 domain-containing protein [Oceanibaculum pacificum]|uniref:Sulfotransferase domain-containing protein n=1 Tax=Oceanibaculum pacificum TaxID=580166 RepID=A0A154VF74_9PROT|nr:sulfotransferase family 2 domain-containing protein [Oceanibaculum pacificum]KZD00022.1 hypothetical protein AUP43_14445 [Oceanibaculum pacificum]
MPTSPIYFLHINKTGGTSLSTVAGRAFPAARSCPAGLVPQLLALPAETVGGYAYYHGHFGLGLLGLLENRPRLMTLLRDPVDRMISQFNAHLRNPATALHRAILDKGGDIEAGLSDPEIAHFLADYQTRSLGLPLDLAAVRAKGAPFAGLQELVAEAARSADAGESLAAAKRTLDGCALICLTERMDDSVARLAAWLDLAHEGPAPRLNVSADNPREGRANKLDRGDLSPRALRLAEELNRHDIALYEHAQALFEARG